MKNHPTAIKEAYSDADKAILREVIDLMNQNKISAASLATKSNLSSGTISLVLSGNYSAAPSVSLKTMRAAIEAHQAHAEVTSGEIVKTSIYTIGIAPCRHARELKTFPHFSGRDGGGKTHTLRDYASNNTNTLFIEATGLMRTRTLLDAILRQLHAQGARRVDEMFENVVAVLKGTNTLIIIDEAETLVPSCLHILRRIRDQAGVGVVLSGTELLYPQMMRNAGVFDQIRSRVSLAPPSIQAISEEDADALTLSLLSPYNPDAECLDALRAYAGGSARMLCENLIPSLIRHGLKKGKALSVALIDTVAVKVLQLSPRAV